MSQSEGWTTLLDGAKPTMSQSDAAVTKFTMMLASVRVSC
jgi:hypothetical protein